MKQPEFKKVEMPRLRKEVKELNGKSTRKLEKCIETLTNMLEDKHEKGSNRASDDPNIC